MVFRTIGARKVQEQSGEHSRSTPSEEAKEGVCYPSPGALEPQGDNHFRYSSMSSSVNCNCFKSPEADRGLYSIIELGSTGRGRPGAAAKRIIKVTQNTGLHQIWACSPQSGQRPTLTASYGLSEVTVKPKMPWSPQRGQVFPMALVATAVGTGLPHEAYCSAPAAGQTQCSRPGPQAPNLADDSPQGKKFSFIFILYSPVNKDKNKICSSQIGPKGAPEKLLHLDLVSQ